MNIQHSSRTDCWGTPPDIIESSRKVLGSIDLDPASDEFFNQSVGANAFFTEEKDGLIQEWSGNVFINPPGGKRKNRSMVQLFWDKLMKELNEGRINQAIFMGFSLECLQTTQRSARSALSFTICVPRKRVKFVSKNGTYNAPSHSNVIVYVPGHEDRTRDFIAEFSKYGVCKL